MATVDWGFRVASDPRFGGGHIARCVSLARAMTAMGDASIVFFTDPGDPPPAAITAAGFACHAERAPEAADAMMAAISEGELDAAICDSYSVPEDAIDRLTRERPLCVFRDHGRRGTEYTTIDIHPEAVPGAKVIAGPRYAPLDPAFAEARMAIEQSNQTDATGPLRVLVAFGLRDSRGTAIKVVQALAGLSSDMTITIAAASSGPNYATLADIVRTIPNVQLIADATDMVPLYRAADLAVGAPGSSQFERACCGLPTVLLPQSDVQGPLAQAWEASGAAVFASDPAEAAELVARLIDRPDERQSLRARAMALVDGNGAARLAAALTERVTVQAA